jgi:hypothetical protein
MDINKNCKLFLRGVYLYDISSCHYVILEKLGFDISKIDKDDKEKRNTQIGLAIRDNPRLGSMLRNITTSTIDEYLKENNISENDIILRQYDGILLIKRLTITKGHIPLDLQKFFDMFIISIDRSCYLGFTSDSITIKGISSRYQKMDEVYRKLSRINYNSKESVFRGLEEVRKLIFNTDDIMLFCIESDEDRYSVFLKQYGEIEVSKSTAKLLDMNEIDRQKYFDFYLKPFTMSICKEFL